MNKDKPNFGEKEIDFGMETVNDILELLTIKSNLHVDMPSLLKAQILFSSLMTASLLIIKRYMNLHIDNIEKKEFLDGIKEQFNAGIEKIMNKNF